MAKLALSNQSVQIAMRCCNNSTVNANRPAAFFFFQAEDGIRYRDVTGVQTCALPILSRVVLPSEKFPLSNTSRNSVPSPSMRSEERRVGKSVDLGGRRIIKKKKQRARDGHLSRSIYNRGENMMISG